MSRRDDEAPTGNPEDGEGPSRRATIRTTHDDPTLVARAIAPDNTAEMETAVDGDAVVTTVERETTGGLHSTVDDYAVNVDVATEVAQHANRHADAPVPDRTDPGADQTDTHQ